MATAICMPKLGMTMREGRLVAWSVALGDFVEKGSVLLAIESEKAEVDIEATAGGYRRHLYVEVDDTVPCGTLLAALTDTKDEAFDALALEAPGNVTRAIEERLASSLARGDGYLGQAARGSDSARHEHFLLNIALGDRGVAANDRRQLALVDVALLGA